MVDFGRDPRISDTSRQPKICFCFGPVNNARFRRFTVGQILWHLNTTTSIGETVKTFGTEFCKFYHKGSISPKKRKNC